MRGVHLPSRTFDSRRGMPPISRVGASMTEMLDPYLAIALNFQNTSAVIALVAGVLILVMPKLLNFVVAIYLIALGALGILGYA